jgi:two-component system, NtrC family, response regulator PilR
MKNHILVIDDEPDIRQLLSITLSRMGLYAYCVENLQQAYQAVAEEAFQLCLTDLKLPDGSGLEFVKKMQSNKPDLPIIVITAHGSMDIAITAMKYGAFDFINKPVDLSHLRTLINNAISTNQTPQTALGDFPEIIGESNATLSLKEKIIKVSRSQAPVFIFGESGSGKELVARSIHTHSSRKNHAFIAVNCGAIPKELMESEFFGHIKGSFTGAHQDKQGLFQAANGGTLLLDEIADLPLEMQVKLLRAIQEKTVRPVGAQNEIPIDVRIISATHKNLSQAVTLGSFRNDLFYRINVIEITVPPLRERSQDITLLCKKILNKIALQNSTSTHQISQEAIDTLQGYHFPGNIRELENILERACALAENHIISTENLLFSEAPLSQTRLITAASASGSIQDQTPKNDTTLKYYNAKKQTIEAYLDEIEKDILVKTLQKNRWNRTSTAKELGITFRSLRYRLKKLAIDVDKED